MQTFTIMWHPSSPVRICSPPLSATVIFCHSHLLTLTMKTVAASWTSYTTANYFPAISVSSVEGNCTTCLLQSLLPPPPGSCFYLPHHHLNHQPFCHPYYFLIHYTVTVAIFIFLCLVICIIVILWAPHKNGGSRQSASLSLAMFMFLLIPFNTWDGFSLGSNLSLVLLIKLALIQKACKVFCSLLNMKNNFTKRIYLYIYPVFHQDNIAKK